MYFLRKNFFNRQKTGDVDGETPKMAVGNKLGFQLKDFNENTKALNCSKCTKIHYQLFFDLPRGHE